MTKCVRVCEYEKVCSTVYISRGDWTSNSNKTHDWKQKNNNNKKDFRANKKKHQRQNKYVTDCRNIDSDKLFNF